MAGSVIKGAKGFRGKAMPPPDGWRLLEAREALCPDDVRLYREGGAPFEAAVENDLRGLRVPAIRVPENRADVWLARCLLAALEKRVDLQLMGQKDAWASRTSVPREVIKSALQTVEEGNDRGRWWIILDFQRDIAFIRHYLADGFWAPILPRDLENLRVVTLTKPQFTYAAGVAYFKSRLQELGDHPQPAEADWVAEFHAHFSGVTRAAVRAIRKEHSPASGLKPGRRGRRN
jgi:hypothetical protein